MRSGLGEHVQDWPNTEDDHQDGERTQGQFMDQGWFVQFGRTGGQEEAKGTHRREREWR